MGGSQYAETKEVSIEGVIKSWRDGHSDTKAFERLAEDRLDPEDAINTVLTEIGKLGFKIVK